MNQFVTNPLSFLHVRYVMNHEAAPILANPATLAVFAMGDDAPQHADPRFVSVPLRRYGPPVLEVWQCHPPVQTGREGNIAWARAGNLLFGAIECTEEATQLDTCVEKIYTQIGQMLAHHAMPHVVRLWNTLDAITDGDGDHERYRQFCVGRAKGIKTFTQTYYPAATAVGRQDGKRILQVYWLATNRAGVALENQRQISAFHYPRQYGPQPPSFARAMLPPPQTDLPLFISGTAAVVGHASAHPEDILAQLDEILRNLDALLEHAHAQDPRFSKQLTAQSCLKVYVRDARWMDLVRHQLISKLPHVPHLLLQATICRDDLLLEIEGVHRRSVHGNGG